MVTGSTSLRMCLSFGVAGCKRRWYVRCGYLPVPRAKPQPGASGLFPKVCSQVSVPVNPAAIGVRKCKGSGQGHMEADTPNRGRAPRCRRPPQELGSRLEPTDGGMRSRNECATFLLSARHAGGRHLRTSSGWTETSLTVA